MLNVYSCTVSHMLMLCWRRRMPNDNVSHKCDFFCTYTWCYGRHTLSKCEISFGFCSVATRNTRNGARSMQNFKLKVRNTHFSAFAMKCSTFFSLLFFSFWQEFYFLLNTHLHSRSLFIQFIFLRAKTVTNKTQLLVVERENLWTTNSIHNQMVKNWPKSLRIFNLNATNALLDVYYELSKLQFKTSNTDERTHCSLQQTDFNCWDCASAANI